MKPVAFYDTECYPNYWLLKVLLPCDITHSFQLSSGESLKGSDRLNIELFFRSWTVVSFNGNRYDVPMICAALNGYTCEQLKWLNDQIIVNNAKPWELGLPDWKPADHIDIMEVLPGAGGQKMYAGRIHCKAMRDLPYSPDQHLTDQQIAEVSDYCSNDLSVLEELYNAVQPQLAQRVELGKRYGLDLRSKSDAQLAEAVLKVRCGNPRKREVDWNLRFKYEAPSWLAFKTPQLQMAFNVVKEATFSIGASGYVELPTQLRELEIAIGSSIYRMGIGGLHSSEKSISHSGLLLDIDVASYYPSLILNSGKWPAAMGKKFLEEYAAIKAERLTAKKLEKTLTKGTPEWTKAHVENEGGKIMINGTFGKLGSPYSVLFAPEMLIQTTVTGQLALLMLIEDLKERAGVSVVSGNTDGIIAIDHPLSNGIIEAVAMAWEQRTGLEVEFSHYTALYSRDVNNYIAVKTDGSVKRKGEYAKADLVGKKSPDLEICGDAVADFLAHGVPIAATIRACRDIRKFVTVQKVTGGAVKLWGEGPRKDALVREMVPVLEANGWVKKGRLWYKDNEVGDGYAICDATTAYLTLFSPQRPEYLGKVIRWYYSTNSPGPIIYNTNGNHVSLSYGAKPCMTLPDELPDDIDYEWYEEKCSQILKDVGYVS
jgi:hypothetical protein